MTSPANLERSLGAHLWTDAVLVAPWVASAGRSALRHGVYVYQADPLGLTLGASNGSLAGRPLVRYWLYLTREQLETAYIDLADYAAREIRADVDHGYVMWCDVP